MANAITVTKNTTSGSERWDVGYTVDASGTVTKTMNTAGTLLDRNIKVSVTTAAGALTSDAGSTSASATNLTLGTATTTQPSSGRYITVTGSGTVKVGTAGWLAANTSNVSNTATKYYPVSSATFATSGDTVYCSAAGWVPAGSASSGVGTISSGIAKPPLTISGSSAILSTGTNTLTLTKSLSITPVVTAGYISSGTADNSSVSLTANVTTKAATTFTPSTTDQTIASGTYLTGTQTIKGDTNLIANNIKSGVTIFGVEGNYCGSQLSIIDTLDSHGGIIRTFELNEDINNLYPWLGFGATFLGTEEWDVPLSSTSFDSWSATSTATSILAAATTNDFSYTYNRDTESLIFITNATTKYAYIEGATLKAIPLVTNRMDIITAEGCPNTLTQYQNKTIGTQSYFSLGALARTYYYTTAGALAVNASTVYGIYHYSNPTITSSISGNTVTAGYRRAAIYARCNSNIFATGRKADIDTTNTKIHFKVDVYKVPRTHNLYTTAWMSACDALNSV